MWFCRGKRVFRGVFLLWAFCSFVTCLPLSTRAQVSGGQPANPCVEFAQPGVTVGPGFVFPVRFFPPDKVSGNISSSVCDYEQQGKGTGIGYSSANAPLSIFVVRDKDYSKLDSDGMADEVVKAVNAVFAAQKAGVYLRVQAEDLEGKVVDTPLILEMPMDGVTYFVSFLRTVDKFGQDYKSYVCLTARKGCLVKIRLSLRDDGSSAPLFGYTLGKMAAIVR